MVGKIGFSALKILLQGSSSSLGTNKPVFIVHSKLCRPEIAVRSRENPIFIDL